MAQKRPTFEPSVEEASTPLRHPKRVGAEDRRTRRTGRIPTEPRPMTLRNRAGRLAWQVVYRTLFRPTPIIGFDRWRCTLLRLFGATVGRGVRVYPTSKIWAPWNVELGDHCMVGWEAELYSVGKITLEPHSVVSQYCFLSTGDHDISSKSLPVGQAPIRIGSNAWVSAKVSISPGVTVGEGAVCGMRANVVKDVEPWTVVGGNPAKVLKKRILADD